MDPKLQAEAVAEAKLAPEHMKATGAATPATVGYMGKIKKGLLHGVTYDIHAIVEEDDTLKELHGHAEVFEPRIEMSFSYLQVFFCFLFFNIHELVAGCMIMYDKK